MQVLSIGKRKRVYAIAFSPDGTELAAVSGDYQLRIWNLATGEVRLSTPVEESPSGYDLTFIAPDRLILAGADLRWWYLGADEWSVITDDRVWGRRIKVSPNRELLVEVDQTRSTDSPLGNGLLVRETGDWPYRPMMPNAEHTTGGVAFSADGKFLATGHMAHLGMRPVRRSIQGTLYTFQENDYDYLAHVRELPSGRVVQSLGGWGQAVTHLAFSPDGSVLAGTAGPRLRVWDLKADRELALHKRGPKHFQGLSFAHDGSFLATVSNDATARIWDTGTWQEHAAVTWQIGALLNIAFAPDGLRAAAGSDQGKVIIWDVE
jgi:WD40 repeat protein